MVIRDQLDTLGSKGVNNSYECEKSILKGGLYKKLINPSEYIHIIILYMQGYTTPSEIMQGNEYI